MGLKDLAVLTGDCINEVFFAENEWPFCRAAKNSGRNNEVTVLLRWPQGRVSLYSFNGSNPSQTFVA